jgi:hypothetical protein
MLVVREEQARASRSLFSVAIRCLAAARILFIPNAIVQFNSINLLKKLNHPTRNCDPLYFIVYRFYLSRHFTIKQRVEIAINHHKYELSVYNCKYMEKIYRSDSILL